MCGRERERGERDTYLLTWAAFNPTEERDISGLGTIICECVREQRGTSISKIYAYIYMYICIGREMHTHTHTPANLAQCLSVPHPAATAQGGSLDTCRVCVCIYRRGC